MSLEGVDSDCTIPKQQQQQSASTKPTKPRLSRRLRQVNWIPSSESESFNTVVINYRYDMEHSKGKRCPKQNKIETKKSCLPQQKEQTLEKAENPTNLIEEKESLSEFYLCKLYEESLQDLVKKTLEKEKSKKEDDKKDVIIKDIIQEKGNPDKTHIILEISTPTATDNACEAFHTPPTELKRTSSPKAITGFEPNEIIVISDDEDDEFSFCLPNPTAHTSQKLTTPSIEFKMCAKPKTETASTATNDLLPTHASKGTATTSHNLKTLESKLREILDPEKAEKEEKLKVKVTTLPASFSNQKLKVKMPTSTSTFKSRQLELHRHRIAVEVKRLELLEVKLARERDEMMREQILFEKELELKNSQIKQLKDDLL